MCHLQSLGLELVPSDVYLLATAAADQHTNAALADYLRRIPSDRSTRLRLCLTPGMAAQIGTAGAVQASQPVASKRTA